MNKKYRLCDVEEAVSEMDELIDVDDDIAEIDDDFQIVVSGWSVYVESLNLTLRQGIACVWDAEEGLFMPDFDVTIVYEGNIETQEWLYYEQDGMIVTLGNWLNGRLSCEQIEQLWCELIIPKQNKEQKESEFFKMWMQAKKSCTTSNFFRTVADTIHTAYPFHLVSSFKCFGYAILLCHSRNKDFHTLVAGLINFSQVKDACINGTSS